MKKVRQGWKVSRQILMWMLVISLIVSAVPLLPAQSAVAAELPIQQTAVTKSSGFQDVSPTDWFHDAVVHVQEKGIFSGTNANSFSPKGDNDTCHVRDGTRTDGWGRYRSLFYF
ncbi:S-layer homology domain-containing protein [Paenibacillus amylolyticus]|nr:S-layer homology domain-containing protein [Paenibacillus amylolyticus]